MEELIRKLNEATRTASTLSISVRDLRKERDELLSRVEELEQALAGKEQALFVVPGSQEAARIGQLMIDDGDRQALKAQIDHFLQEIDLCLKRFGD